MQDANSATHDHDATHDAPGALSASQIDLLETRLQNAVYMLREATGQATDHATDHATDLRESAVAVFEEVQSVVRGTVSADHDTERATDHQVSRRMSEEDMPPAMVAADKITTARNLLSAAKALEASKARYVRADFVQEMRDVADRVLQEGHRYAVKAWDEGPYNGEM